MRHFAFGNINALKEEAHKAMSADPQFWLKRPMSDDMLNYAREDVKNLITVYRQLTAPMTQSNIALIMKYSLQYVNQFRYAKFNIRTNFSRAKSILMWQQ